MESQSLEKQGMRRRYGEWRTVCCGQSSQNPFLHRSMNTETQTSLGSLPSATPQQTGSQSRPNLEHAKSEIQSRFSDVKDAAGHAVSEIKTAASAAGQSAKEGYEALREDATERFDNYSAEVRTYVRDNPLKSVGTALLAGLVVGMIARR